MSVHVERYVDNGYGVEKNEKGDEDENHLVVVNGQQNRALQWRASIYQESSAMVFYPYSNRIEQHNEK